MSRNPRMILAGGLLSLALAAGTAWGQQIATMTTSDAGASSGIEVVEQANANSPLVSIRLQFAVGSIHDPAGKEGLAELTGVMIADSGTAKRSYADLVEALYPMAAAINSNVDREVTLIAGTVHRDKLADYTALLEEALLTPGFSQSDFDRNKEQLSAALTNNLRSNDEALGLELLQNKIYQSHPYGHSPVGTVDGLKSITLDDVKAFYKQHYTQANLMLGVAGGYPKDYVGKLRQDLAALPPGVAGSKDLPPAPKVEGRNFAVVEKQTGSVGIHFGFPLP